MITKLLRRSPGIIAGLGLLLATGSTSAFDRPRLTIVGNTIQVSWEAIIPPTTNFYPAEIQGTNFWLQVGHLGGQWETIQPKLDSFPDIWVTNSFAATFPQSSAFFRIVNDPSLQTNSMPPPATLGVKPSPMPYRPRVTPIQLMPPPPPTNWLYLKR